MFFWVGWALGDVVGLRGSLVSVDFILRGGLEEGIFWCLRMWGFKV